MAEKDWCFSISASIAWVHLGESLRVERSLPLNEYALLIKAYSNTTKFNGMERRLKIYTPALNEADE